MSLGKQTGMMTSGEWMWMNWALKSSETKTDCCQWARCPLPSGKIGRCLGTHTAHSPGQKSECYFDVPLRRTARDIQPFPRTMLSDWASPCTQATVSVGVWTSLPQTRQKGRMVNCATVRLVKADKDILDSWRREYQETIQMIRSLNNSLELMIGPLYDPWHASSPL